MKHTVTLTTIEVLLILKALHLANMQNETDMQMAEILSARLKKNVGMEIGSISLKNEDEELIK